MNAHDNIENLVDHEVRIRSLERIEASLEKKFDKLDSKINWIVGLIVTSMISVLLHSNGFI